MNQRFLAFSFAFLMLASIMPAAEATHTDPLLPVLPILPQAEPTRECIPLGITPEVLARVNHLVAGDPAFYRNDVGVPALCLNGQPVPQYVTLIAQLNDELERLRNLTREIQDQVDYRVEATLPEGTLPEDLVEPKVILLNETFSGRRTTGFGEWAVVTQRGEDPVWDLRTRETLNGTRTTYRFGDDTGYEQGAHQFLVSPEIDLTALKANKTAIQDLVAARDLAQSRMRAICYEGTQPLPPPVTACQTDHPNGRFQAPSREPITGQPLPGAPLPHLSIILTAYEMAFDETVYQLPVMQHAATLDLTYKFNMADYTDGVRLWIYAGDRQPDRSVLFDPDFSKGAVGQSCARDPVVPVVPPEGRPAVNGTGNRNDPNDRNENEIGKYVCTTTLHGGQVIELDPPLMKETKAFQNAVDPQNASAFSGDSLDFITTRINLTDWAEHRIWILFEVKTLSNDRGLDTFEDPGSFTRLTDFGFELARVYVEGAGYHRNLRLKDIGATFPHVTANNEFGDDPRTVRTTLPPGNESIVVYLHNAGDYTENATFTLNAARAAKGSAAFSHAGTYTLPVTLVPDEVRTLRIPWSTVLDAGAMQEDHLYRLSGALQIPGMNVTLRSLNSSGMPDQLPPGTDPNATAARPVNAAGNVPGAGAVSLTQLVRSDTARNLTPVRFDGQFGVPLQFCSGLEGRTCEELYAARKGEQRIALIGVRNDGNTVQDVEADLIVELDGVAKSDVIAGGPRQTLRDMLPGETRPVMWTLTPTEPGAYRVAVALMRADGVAEPLVERRLFVQRSTGLICLDTFEPGARECGPAFDGDLVPLLREQNITAATLAADGTLYVATEIAEPDVTGAHSIVEGAHSGMLAARSPDGEWRIVANLSGEVLNLTFGEGPIAGHGWGDVRSIVIAPDQALWLVGENLTILRLDPAGLSRPTLAGVSEETPAPEVDLTSAIWHNGTLLAAGTNGTLARLDDQNVTLFKVTNSSATHTTSNEKFTYLGNVSSLVRAPNGDAFLLGEHGVMLRNTPGESEWRETTLGGNLTAWAVSGGTLHAATTHDGRFYVAGENALFVNEPGSYSLFRNITPPVPLQNLTTPRPDVGLTEYVDVFSAHDGTLYTIDYEGRLASCVVCTGVLVDWLYPEIARPPVVGKGPTHPARLFQGVADAERTILVGEAGLVLTLGQEGIYANSGGWSTVPALAPRDGGAFETAPSGTPGTVQDGANQSILAMPGHSGQQIANEADKFRLYLNHSVHTARNASPVEVHLVYTNVPSHNLGGSSGQTQTCGTMSQQGTSTSVACNAQRVRHLVAVYGQPTQYAGWEPRIFDNLPSAQLAAGAANPDGVASFFAVELYAAGTTRWAIDDFHLQGWRNGKWVSILEWRGPGQGQHNGTFWYSSAHSTINAALVPAGAPPVDAIPAPVNQTLQWRTTTDTPFGLDTISPWHLTTQYADRPVFAANNEFYKTPALSGGSVPVIYSGWDSRLVSPVIDLRDAFDPVIAFDHTYAFRVQAQPSTTTVMAGDGGLVELQYLRQGPDCGSESLLVTCGWSDFYVVRPDADYPTKQALGYGERTANADGKLNAPSGRIGHSQTTGQGQSYWGRIAKPDETGLISSPRFTDTYVQERITLSNVTCKAVQLDQIKDGGRPDCVPTNLSGRQVRVAFHMLTGGGRDGSDIVWNASHPQHKDKDQGKNSFPGEGWYISNLKVLGASKLGIDLVAKDMGFRVGYDVGSIGVGPGTRVPVNVTVHNNGAFDALGYTGRLQVDRVLNRALKTTVPVETIHLSQQPVLESNRSVNHTIVWNVPSLEGAEYVLTFTVEPIGIDRDEDFLDNVARIGSVSQPVPAQTVRRFHTEFLVSPENATIDITRYMPMFINNTGNVPLDQFTIERRITIIGRSVDADADTCAQWRTYVLEGRQTAIVDCRVWQTDRAAPPGALTPLTALSDDVSPSVDLFWKAPERASYLVAVTAETPVGSSLLVSGVDRRVSAFATYLFDDVEGGPRGESDSGEWVFGEGWNAAQPGFRSTDSYAFGDPLLKRYPADRNDSIVSPTIDLGNARTASAAWFHKFGFEAGFDGGVVEASVDGVNWSVVPVAADSLVRAGYNVSAGHHVQPGSPIHPDGDPEKDDVRAFTGDSSLHPSNVDGWVLSELDFTDFAAVTERGVEYEAYSSVELQQYKKNVATPIAPGTLSDPTWCVGPAEEFRCWESQNITAHRVPPTGPGTEAEPNTMWWSGSPAPGDDQVRPIQNHALAIPVPLGAVAPDHVVVAEWWEYASRFNELSVFMRREQAVEGDWPEGLQTIYAFHPGSTNPTTTRYNLGQPEIVGKDGKWYHMRTDITSIVRDAQRAGQTELRVAFSYTPVHTHAAGVHAVLAGTEGASYDAADLMEAENATFPGSNQGTQTGTLYGASNRYADDPGFAIDGFAVTATRIVRGQPLGAPLTIIDEAAAWENRYVFECGNGDREVNADLTGNHWRNGNTAGVACLDKDEGWVEREPLETGVGRNWNAVTSLPAFNGTWGVVDVLDQEGRSKLPTGDLAKAWWSGELPHEEAFQANDRLCRRGPEGKPDLLDTCVQPGSESRLVTPAIDLGRVAGNNAQLRFWHRYAFSQFNDHNGGLKLSSGGVVEVQEYDAQRGAWGEWRQLYSAPLDTVNKGGYTGYVANVSRGNDGVHRFDPPFHNVVVDGEQDPVQFLYTGKSGWVEAKYDVRDLIGKRVRFGFHVSFTDELLLQQADTVLVQPDGPTSLSRGGWWIGDVAVVGDVIVGQPVQLRWRAGTDGNVDEGLWLLDDLGVYGSRYRNNVGLFVDTAKDAFGAYNDTTARIPVTVRNMGDSVRRDLAVEIINVDSGVLVNLTAPDAAEVGYGRVDGRDVFRIEGITLGPGQSITVDLHVRAPRLKPVTPHTDLLMTLKEFSTASPETPFVAIVDNEVQGLLSRIVRFSVQREPEAVPLGGVVQQILPEIGSQVEVDVRYHNPGYGPSHLDLACRADTVTGWNATNHDASDGEDAIVAASYACDLVEGELIVPPKETVTLRYRATPTEAGFLRFRIEGNVTREGVEGEYALPPVVIGTAVGVSPLRFDVPFDTQRQTQENITLRNVPGSGWDHLRGNRAPGALVVGIDENTSANGGTYSGACAGVCRAITDPIDLHNYSTSNPAFLSFWHMDRLAKHDGARVVARVLENELRPNAPGEPAWSAPCILEPRGGWEGAIRRVPPSDGSGSAEATPGDDNPAFNMAPAQYSANRLFTDVEYFVADGGLWEESWELAVFDLSQPCEQLAHPRDKDPFTLVGRTVRFEFEVFAGPLSDGVLNRGRGQGMLVDDISVGPLSVVVRPLTPQRATLLDNTTKAFNVLVENVAASPDIVVLEYDALNSSAPAGTVWVPSEPMHLAPGESRTIQAQVTLPRDPSLLPTEFKVRLVARSVIDPNAAGASTLELAFAPREWAELSIATEAPSGIVQEGTEAFIPITIENNGLVESVATVIRITDTWADGSAVVDIPLAAIPAYAVSPEESTRVVEFRWRPEKGTIGEHTLTFEIDPDVLGQEYLRENNVATLTVPVSELLIPDLEVGNFSALSLRNAAGGVVTPGFDADVARYEVTAGELVSFELKVANEGRAGATNVDVRAFIGALSLPPKTIPYIAPGTEAVVTFNWLAQKGEHQIEFVVRSEQVELSGANNRYPGTGVTLLTVKGYEIEVEIGNLAQLLLEPGTTIDVPFSIRNAGNAGEDLVLRASAPSGARVMLPREGFFLRAGETYTDRARLILDAEAVAGEHFITIDAVARDNPMKVATGRAAMRVNASYGGSVVGALASGAPPGFVIPIELVNEGNSLEPWSVHVRLPAGWSSQEPMPAKVVVPAHGRVTYDLFVNVPVTTAPGDRVMKIEATMPNGEVREGLATTTVLPLRAASVAVGDDVPKPARGALSIPVVVENKGNVQQPFEVLLVDAPAGLEMSISPAVFDLPPGGKAVAALVVKPNQSVEAGTYAITGYMRFDGVTPQTSEGRGNLQTIKVPIVRQDLRLSPLEFSPRAGLDAGDRVTVKVSVTNRGLSELTDVPVHLFVDDVFIEEVVLASIASGARADVTFNWTAVTGVHTLTAVVDPYADTVDADRADNAVSALATVGTEVPAGGVAAGRANTPAPGILGMIVALAAAVFLATQGHGRRRQRR